MSRLRSSFGASAYGGPGWSGRTKSLRAELGEIWADCGVGNEWGRLRAVLLHRPGAELAAAEEPDAVQMLAPIDLGKAQAEHDAIAQAYRDHGVEVHLVEPGKAPPPNQMFVADLMFMTPEGAVLGRPASTVRAGEERQIARRLADIGIPILRSLRGTATFEGADAAWLDPQTVLIGRGLRTNAQGIAQVGAILEEMGVTVIAVDLPFGTMHMMGTLRFADRDLAVGFPRRVPFASVEALRARGFEVIFLPDDGEAEHGSALNFVTLAPRRVLMVDGNPATRTLLEAHGVESVAVPAAELRKAAGAIGCLTGILRRDDG
jgi:N-dimethylarginine dimethylaminohydrolase